MARTSPRSLTLMVNGFSFNLQLWQNGMERAFWSNTLSLAAVAISILALLLGFSVASTRSIVRPINKTTAALQDISHGEGDLTRRLDEGGWDEIAQLSLAFNHFTQKIQQIIINVSQISYQLATAAEELSSTASQNHEYIEQQLNETQQVATAVTEEEIDNLSARQVSSTGLLYKKSPLRDFKRAKGNSDAAWLFRCCMQLYWSENYYHRSVNVCSRDFLLNVGNTITAVHLTH